MNNVTFYPSDAARYLKKLGLDMSGFPKDFNKARVAALNRAGTAVNNRAGSMMMGQYAVKKNVATSRLKLTKAKNKDMDVLVSGRGYRISLVDFNAQKKTVRKKPKAYQRGASTVIPKKRRPYYGVSVKVLKADRRKPVQSGFMGHAQAGHNRGTGALHIFKRFNEKLGVLRGPSLVSLLNQESRTQELMDLGRDTLLKRLEHEARYRLKKLGAK